MQGSLRAGLCALAIAVAAAALAGSAQAGQQCWQVILNEWSSGGTVSTSYDIQCYDAAVANAPDDLLVYSSFEGDVSSAKRRAVRSQAQPGNSGGTSGSGSAPQPAQPPGAQNENAGAGGAGKNGRDADAEASAEGESADEDAGASGAPGAQPPAGTSESRGDATGETPEPLGDEASAGASAAEASGEGAAAVDSEAASALETIESGSMPAALIAIVVVAALLLLGTIVALAMRRRGPHPPEPSASSPGD